VRCRRESKECYFSATRRKRKSTSGGSDSHLDVDADTDYELRNARKRVRVSDDDVLHGARYANHRPSQALLSPAHLSMSPTTTAATTASSSSVIQPPQAPLGRHGEVHHSPVSPGAAYHGGQYPPAEEYPAADMAVPGMPSAVAAAAADTAVDEQRLTAEKLLHTEVYSGHDALNLLFEAAGRSGDIVNTPRDNSPVQSKRSPPAHESSPYAQTATAGAGSDGGVAPPMFSRLPEVKCEPSKNVPIDPALSNAVTHALPTAVPAATGPTGYKAALQAWARCRFVRAGWFTAREAIGYIK
jgi:hypothetical protein